MEEKANKARDATESNGMRCTGPCRMVCVRPMGMVKSCCGLVGRLLRFKSFDGKLNDRIVVDQNKQAGDKFS